MPRSAPHPAAPSTGHARPATKRPPRERVPQHTQPKRHAPQPEPHPRPSAALSAVRLTHVRPVLNRAEVQAYEAERTRLAHHPVHDVARALSAALGHPVPPGAVPLQVLMEALEAACPLKDLEVIVRPEDAYLSFTFENQVDSTWQLSRLHEHLRHQDPGLLPGILAMIERLTAAVAPCIGPRGAEEYGHYWWSLERLSEIVLEGRHDTDRPLTERETLNLARRLGLDHEWRVRDETPFAYFTPPLPEGEVLTRLDALGGLYAGVAAALRALGRSSAALSRMTDPEAEQVTGLPPVTHVFMVHEKAHCAQWELMDEFMRYHFEGGEHEPCRALHVTADARSVARAVRTLKAYPAALRAVDRVAQALWAVEESLDAPGSTA